ncbi:zinc-dependent peptidase [Algibacter sp. TI.3.09]|uniref:zinc-dependent peptidase n=1 Tax=Algibacter sp. TI.3.09 TaxID=3121298 RepID=UPI00311DBA07
MTLLIQNDKYYIGTIIVAILVGVVIVMIFVFIKRVVMSIVDGLEMMYTFFTKRPAFVHLYVFIKKMKPEQIRILEEQFTFYNRLDEKNKLYFRHRVASFIDKKQFIGKEDFLISEQVQVLVSATAVMLTFGFRDFMIEAVENIIIYPTRYYSQLNKQYHKGEFNAKLKTLVLSWDSFMEGYRIEDDKLNLGIHEFAHAIHFNSIYQEDINSIIFIDTFNELRALISSDEFLKKRLVTSEYLRDYAFTNDFELLAVIVETFIETPQAFRNQFPVIYFKVRQMLNFDFPSY